MRNWLYGLVLLSLMIGVSTTARAQTPGPPVVKTDFSKFLPSLGYSFTRGLFSRENVTPMIVGGCFTLMAYPYDGEISEVLVPYADSIGETGQILGSPVVIAVAAGSIVAAPFSKNDRFRAFSFDLAQGAIMNYAIVQAVKYSVSRMRPNGEDNTSFPSGHSADSFMLATILNHYCGKKFGIPAYAAAAFVAFSRIEKEKHFPSDVIFGSTLGYVIAKTAIRGHSGRTPERLTFFPVVSRRGVGVDLVITLP